MIKKYIHYVIAFVLLCLVPSSAWADTSLLSENFGSTEDSLTVALIAQHAGQDSAAVYKTLDREYKAQFLRSFWAGHNPVLLQFYYGYYLGHHQLTVSDAFFERGQLIPQQYKTGAVAPDVAIVEKAVEICRGLMMDNPGDLVAQNALGYCLLEQSKGVEAEGVFLKVLQKDRHFLAARHGRALACLIQEKQVGRALDFFQNTVSLDSDYEAAVYNMAMCHLARRSVDLNHHFGNVVKRFPMHYDAYFKLGVFYEGLYYFDKAVKALSQQVVVNPAHARARGRLARVTMELKYLKDDVQSTPELRDLAQKDPVRYLPILGAQYLEAGDYDKSAAAFAQYLTRLSTQERAYYLDVTLLLSPEEHLMHRMVRGDERRDFVALFWRKQDPTPTTSVNERQLEHFRRVYYARQNFSEGRDPWDARGDVYVRFGHPDHRSWSDHLVFETDPDVVRVKNRLTDRAGEALLEAIPDNSSLRIESFGDFTMMMAPEVRGVPIFPLPHQGALFRDGASLNSKWETWVYAHIGDGFEVTFLDALGDFDFQFPQPPVNSPNVILWQKMAPETVVARVISRTPSVYKYDYGTESIPMYLSVADFQGTEKSSRLDAFIGVPWASLARGDRDDVLSATLKRMLVVFDTTGAEVWRDSLIASASQFVPIHDPGVLWVDQVTADLDPGRYFLAVRVENPVSGAIQIYRQETQVEAYGASLLMVSDLAVAGQMSELSELSEGKFIRGDLEVIPLPSQTFKPEQPIFLYYEVYNLLRDETGQTRYRVDYAVEGADETAGVRLLRGIGRLLGIKKEEEGVTVSYEHRGDQTVEQIYVALNVAPKPGKRLKIAVTVTDLKVGKRIEATKDVYVMIGDK